jgi:hypothetical protein
MRGMGQFQTCLYFVAQAGPTHPDRAVCPWRSGAVLRTAASVQCRGKQSTEAELLRILPPARVPPCSAHHILREAKCRVYAAIRVEPVHPNDRGD